MGKGEKSKPAKRARATAPPRVAQKLAQPKSKEPRKPSARRKGPFRSLVDPREALQHYRAALMRPFCVEAEGARLPGPFAFPTVTRRLKSMFSFTSDNIGDFSAVVYPHPTFTVATIARAGRTVNSMAGPTGVGTFAIDALSTGGVNSAIAASAANWTGFVDSSALSSYCNQWRVVGGGVRLIPTGNFTNVQGVFTAAPVPLHGEVVIPATTGRVIQFQSNSATSNVFDLVGPLQWPAQSLAGGTDATLAGIDNLPDSATFAGAQLLESGGKEMVFRPISPEAQNFRATNIFGLSAVSGIDSIQLGQGGNFTGATNIQQNLATSAQTAGSGGVGGFAGIAIYGTGLNNGLTYTMEICMHLEVAPVLSSGVTGAIDLTAQVGTSPPPIPTAAVEAVMMQAAAANPIVDISTADRMGDALTAGVGMFEKIASTVGTVTSMMAAM